MIIGCDHGNFFPPKLIAPNPEVMHSADNIAPSQSMVRSSALKRPEPRTFSPGPRGGSASSLSVTAVRQIKANGAWPPKDLTSVSMFRCTLEVIAAWHNSVADTADTSMCEVRYWPEDVQLTISTQWYQLGILPVELQRFCLALRLYWHNFATQRPDQERQCLQGGGHSQPSALSRSRRRLTCDNNRDQSDHSGPTKASYHSSCYSLIQSIRCSSMGET